MRIMTHRARGLQGPSGHRGYTSVSPEIRRAPPAITLTGAPHREAFPQPSGHGPPSPPVAMSTGGNVHRSVRKPWGGKNYLRIGPYVEDHATRGPMAKKAIIPARYRLKVKQRLAIVQWAMEH